MLKKGTIEEKDAPKAQFGHAKSVEFEIPGKVSGCVIMFESGALDILVLDSNWEELLNVLIVNQNENSDKEKEEAFNKLMSILTQ